MYCPKCGYQQVLDDMRFCSRCGFQLAGVAELLAADGIAPAKPGILQARAPRISRRGARLLFFSIVTAPVFIIFSAMFDSPVPLLGSFFFFLAGLAHIAYQLIFGESLLLEVRKERELLSTGPEPYLRPAEGIPASDLFRRETADFTSPPSITESTTKLFEKELEIPDSHPR